MGTKWESVEGFTKNGYFNAHLVSIYLLQWGLCLRAQSLAGKILPQLNYLSVASKLGKLEKGTKNTLKKAQKYPQKGTWTP